MATRPLWVIPAALRQPVINAGPVALSQSCPTCHRPWSSRPLWSAKRKTVRRDYATALAAAPYDSLKNSPPASSGINESPQQAPLGRETPLRQLKAIREILRNEIGGASHWEERTAAAIGDLAGVRRGRIGIFGDSLSAPRDLVSALLQDPVADSVGCRKRLLSRYDTSATALLLSPERIEPTSGASLVVVSSLLQISGYDMVEISGDAEATLSHLLSSDIAVLILDPIRLLATETFAIVAPPLIARERLHFVINGLLPPGSSEKEVEERLRKQVNDVISADRSTEISMGVTFVQTAKALGALEVLATGLEVKDASAARARAAAFDLFQSDFLASNVGRLRQSLLDACLALPDPQVSTADGTATLALGYIDGVVAGDRHVIEQALQRIAELRNVAQQAGIRAQHLSVISKGITGGAVKEGVEHELAVLRQHLEARLGDRWSMLGLITRLRVDDVGTEMSAVIERDFGLLLNRQLVFESGQLAELQQYFSKSSDVILRQLAAQPKRDFSDAQHPFSSPLLLNSLSTLSLNTPLIHPTSLLDPTDKRRDQLLSHSVPRLQKSATRAVLRSYALALASVSASWTVCVQPIAFLDAATAIATGLFGVVAAVVTSQRSWARAQSRFWRDWKRVTSMLQDDLKTRLEAVIQAQVLAKPLACAEGLDELVGKRRQRLEDLQRRVDDLRPM